MPYRTATIGLIHQAALAGMEAEIRSWLGIRTVEYHDHLIYTAMLQAGVQRFRIPGPLPKHIQDSQFLRRRCKEYPFEQYKKVMDSIGAIISEHTIRAAEPKSQDTFFGLTFFLSDLIIALQTKSAMVDVLGLPNPAKYSGRLSPEMQSSINGLLKKIKPVSLDLPIPQWRVLSEDVKVFQEIISSDLFASYSASHYLLESSEEKEQSVFKEILSKARKLCERFGGVLDTRRLPLSLIPVTASLIDSVCGKLPGSVANVFGNALTEALRDRKRVTIYNYRDVHLKLIAEYYANLKAPRKDKLRL